MENVSEDATSQGIAPTSIAKTLGSFRTRNRCYLIVSSDLSEAATLSEQSEATMPESKERSVETELPSAGLCQFLLPTTTGSQMLTVVEATEPENDPVALLTQREFEIVRLVAFGWANKQIARRLDISQWTVSTHLRRIFLKLEVDTRAAMVYRCAVFL